MSFVNLGMSGLKVSDICLGTMTFGREADEEMSFRIMDRFVELGHNFIDTADTYSSGGSEEVVGRWLKSRKNRENLVIATKVYNPMGPGPNDRGLSRIHILKGVEDSLRRLGTEVIDLYQIHRWDPAVPPEETLDALTDLVRQGKVRYVGASNLTAWQLSLFREISRREGLVKFVSIQPVYNAVNRGIETELLPYAAYEGIGVISYNPLAGGFLTGKYGRGGQMPEGSRLKEFEFYKERYYSGPALDIADRFTAFAKDHGWTPAQLALAWVKADPRITAPIIGARNLDQFNDTIGGLGIRLGAEEREAVPSIGYGSWVGKDPVYDR